MLRGEGWNIDCDEMVMSVLVAHRISSSGWALPRAPIEPASLLGIPCSPRKSKKLNAMQVPAAHGRNVLVTPRCLRCAWRMAELYA